MLPRNDSVRFVHNILSNKMFSTKFHEHGRIYLATCFSTSTEREASERFCWILQEERKMREQERELREESQQWLIERLTQGVNSPTPTTLTTTKVAVYSELQRNCEVYTLSWLRYANLRVGKAWWQPLAKAFSEHYLHCIPVVYIIKYVTIIIKWFFDVVDLWLRLK